MTLIYDDEIIDWVSLGIFGKSGQFKDCRSIGVIKDGRLIAGVVYSNMISTPDGIPYMLEMSIHSIDKRWASRHTLRALFSFPFIQLGLKRVQTHCSLNDREIIMFNKRLGFIQEGVHREFWPMGGDSVSFAMLKNECKWIKNG